MCVDRGVRGTAVGSARGDSPKGKSRLFYLPPYAPNRDLDFQDNRNKALRLFSRLNPPLFTESPWTGAKIAFHFDALVSL
jgi:hypothetical protein